MKWSKTKPAEPGFYFVRTPHYRPEDVDIVKVFAANGALYCGSTEELDQHDDSENVCLFSAVYTHDVEWSGPIPLPEEAT